MADSIRFSFDTGSKKQQFIVLCPQSENGFPSPISINLIIDYMVAKYRVDASRIYLLG
jgi:predicted peptidase